jgi:cytochrome P450
MDSFTIILINVIPVLLIFLLFRRWKSAKAVNLPPGPPKLPLIGSLLHMGQLPHRSLKELAGKYGPLMHIQLGEISAIVVSSPRVAKLVMKTHDLSFASRPVILASEIVGYHNTDIAFAPYGDYWRQMRKIATLELLSAKKVRSFCYIREEEAKNLIESIHSTSGKSFDLTEKVFSLTNNVICRATFGDRYKDQDYLIKILKQVVNLAGGFDVADLFPSLKLLHLATGMRPKLENLRKDLDRIFDEIINERTKRLKNGTNTHEDNEDIVDVLVRLKESGALEFPITQNNIKAVILDMFLAGSDTSSTTIEWAMAEMMRNPRVLEKAQAELRQATNGKKVIEESDIKETGSYFKLVIKETLRMHPPVALLLPRECREECEIDGYTIPVKTKVMVNAWAIGRDPEHWKDADSFYPERFENSDVDYLGSNYEFIPFGSGRRICPGMTFGLANVELPLANLLYHFDWKLPSGMKPEDVDMTEDFGASLRIKNNLHVVARRYSYSS